MTAVGGARICNAMPELEPRQQLAGADRLLLPAKVAKAPMLLEVVAEKLSAYPSIKQGRGLIVQRNSGCLIARTVFLRVQCSREISLCRLLPTRPSRRGVLEQAAKLPPRADPAFGEHLAEMPFHGPGANE